MTQEKSKEIVDLNQAKNQAADILAWGTAVVVDNPEVWRQAREKRAGLKKLLAAIEAHFKKMKQPWDEGKKKILTEEKAYVEPIESALDQLDPKILSYDEEFFRDRKVLQSQLQEDARHHAEEERLRQASDLEKDGDHEGARRLMEQPLYVPPVKVPEFSDWLNGEGRNETWGVDEERIDIIALAKAVVEGAQPAELICPNTKALNAMAKALKETFAVPGCRAVRRRGITQR